jgi:2,3-bisphosphoglycerate-independent phosphoglycerate mutase
MKKRVLLMSLDGWGLRTGKKGNAIATAKTPVMDALWKLYPHATLKAAGKAVGLPAGYMGNSEVGHIHLGSGRLIPQELMLINKAIKDKSFFKNKELLYAMQYVKKNKTTLHVMGLCSDKGVHSHMNHLFALLKLAKMQKVQDVVVHCFLDGRDAPPKSARKYVKKIQMFLKKHKLGRIGTLMGRYYAMDRDNRWNREHKAYSAMVKGKGLQYKDPLKAISAAYARGETDEFVKPSIICDEKYCQHVRNKDAIVFFNFRSDRAREITRAFVQGKFNKFKRKKLLNLCFVSLVQYDKKIKTRVAFPPRVPEETLGEVLSKKGLSQLRVAETEKYAHVTYFFNNGKETPFPREERILIPSPKVTTYDKTPAMSAPKITKKVIAEIKKNRHSLIVMNFANADMVGHTGNFKAAVKAVEVLDGCIEKVVREVLKQDWACVITADHGNAEDMRGKHKTSHTTDTVPCILVSNKRNGIKIKKKGSLQHVAPTVLQLLEVQKPEVMVKGLIVK